MAAITQRSYGLSGPRYGSFAGKGAVGDDGTGEVLLSPPLIEGLGAFATDSYTGSGAILVSPPLVEGTGAFAGVGEESGSGALLTPGAQVEGTGAIAYPSYTGAGEVLLSPPLTAATGGFAGVGEESGAGDLLVPGALVEGTGAFVEGPEPEVYIGVMGTCPEWTTISGDTIVTISGDSLTLANECETLLSGLQFTGSGTYSVLTGSGEILLPPPQVEGVGEYADPLLGTADLQLAGLQFQATGLYRLSPCVVSANIDLGPLVSCNTQGQAISANKDC